MRPPEFEQVINSGGKQGINDDLIATLGLPSDLQSILDWAVSLNLVEPLLLVIEASSTAHNPKHLGTVLSYLKSPLVSEYLSSWLDERPFLAGIQALSDAYSISPGIVELHPPLPPERAVGQQLRGQLSSMPVVALVGRPVKSDNKDDERWGEAVRLWCFIQHLERVNAGRETSNHLAAVTDQIRMAVDLGGDKLTFLLKLRSPTDSLAGLSRSLEARCDTLRQDGSEKARMLGVQKLFLTNLKSVCSRSESDGTLGTSPARDSLLLRFQASQWHHIGAKDHFRPFLESSSESDDSDELPPHAAYPFDQTDEEAVLSVVEVDALDSPVGQAKAAQGVLLSTLEDQQYLAHSWNRLSVDEVATLHHWIDETWANPNHADAPVALACWLAVRTAHSIRTVLNLEISSSISDDWSLDLLHGSIHRAPPVRYNGWRADARNRNWLSPRTGEIRIDLPQTAKTLLSQLADAQSNPCSRLADILPDSQSIEARFNSICKQTPGLSRVMSGMLRQHLAQQVFERSKDSTLAQLLASHPRTGLPGNCGYAAFGQDAVTRSLTPVSGNPIIPSYGIRIFLTHLMQGASDGTGTAMREHRH